MSAEPTRDQIRAGIEAQICPWCGAGPFKILALHTTRLHGVDRFQLRDLGGFTYSASVCSPEASEDRREIARSGQPPTPSRKGTKRRLSEAGKQIAIAKLDASRSEDQRRAATAAAHQPAAKAKRSESLRQSWNERRGHELEHGDYRRYKTGCRCAECRAANTAHFREYRAARRAAAGGGA